MNRDQSRNLIRQTFPQAFDKNRFRNFVIDLLNHLDESKASAMTVPDAFTPHIRSCWRLGTYKSPEGELADVLIVNTTEAYKLERTRTALRDFVAHKLKRQDSYKEAGLVAFVSPDPRSWRFSYIRMEYESKRDAKTGKIAVEERLTPARRFSYIVGEGESCHTAQTRFVDLLQDTETDPKLDDIKEAFSVEAVTKEFFEEYKRVFRSVEGAIEGISHAGRKRLFTQRLFNRLMFIAFIQRKGWLKLGGSSDYLNALWEAYERQKDGHGNFYADRLKRLFFHGLNTANEVNLIGINRGGHLKAVIGEVPYLNGGLFEEDADDQDPQIRIPDPAIDAVLRELFNRFNFTVMESTPLDVEVAVDPEMLGKVFEELVTGRHESGSYYTPKPVVSFMCREALKGYLKTAVGPGLAPASEGTASRAPAGESPEAIERFVEEHNPAGLKNPEPVLEALRKMKVCDPACGSGAYLLGMLHELIDLRGCLFATRKLDAISTFDRKLQIIQNNLYGVDLDPFAVNIARLRLWLSLAVEYEGDNPPPLPNLDFKIETGDSLTIAAPSGGLEQGFRKPLLDEYLKLKAEFLTAHHGHKIELRKQIGKIRETIHGWAHTGSAVDGFDWAVEFTEVFADGGFNIVLANPPYVRQELIKELKPRLKEVYTDVYMGTADLYCYFYARGLQLLRQGGMLVFISSDKWFRANYGAKLREYIAKMCHIESITDFGDLPVFETATAYPMIFVAQVGPGQGDPRSCAGAPARLERPTQKAGASPGPTLTQVKSLEPPYPDVRALIREQGHILPADAFKGSTWTLADTATSDRLRKMEANGIPLGEYVKGQIYYGVKTGFNEAFVIDCKKRAELIAVDPKSAEVIRPLVVGKDIRKWCAEWKDRWLIVTPVDVPIKRYPAVLSHLKQWHAELEKRWDKGNHWWELRSCDYYESFKKAKIIYPVITKHQRFALDREGSFTNDKVFMIPRLDEYLLAVLNSQTMWGIIEGSCSKLRGGFLELRTVHLSKFPIPDPPSAERAAIAALAQKCLDAKGVGCEKWEAEINERVAALYGL